MYICLQLHMDAIKRARLRAFLFAEHKRGTSCNDAVIEVRRQFGENAIDARTAAEWFDELAAGKPNRRRRRWRQPPV